MGESDRMPRLHGNRQARCTHIQRSELLAGMQIVDCPPGGMLVKRPRPHQPGALHQLQHASRAAQQLLQCMARMSRGHSRFAAVTACPMPAAAPANLRSAERPATASPSSSDAAGQQSGSVDIGEGCQPHSARRKRKRRGTPTMLASAAEAPAQGEWKWPQLPKWAPPRWLSLSYAS